MSMPRILLILTVILFSFIGIASLAKSKKSSVVEHDLTLGEIEIQLEPESSREPVAVAISTPVLETPIKQEGLPEANRIDELFNTGEPKFPIVETVAYKSKVEWNPGRPAWISDYARHYNTSRHFIARSLNGHPDYMKQDVGTGDRFNVFKEGKNIEFYLLIDILTSKLWFYYLDLDTNERVLMKTYQVGLGRPDPKRPSGSLTPLGKFSLGDKIAIYKPKTISFHNGEKTEMIRIFGTRWIPFDKEISGTTAPARGLGIHGLPWVTNDKGELVEDLDSLGGYKSDGCIRLRTEDIEEIFAIVITKPTTVELVRGFHTADLPGIEK